MSRPHACLLAIVGTFWIASDAVAQRGFVIRDHEWERKQLRCVRQNYACETVTSLFLEEDNAQVNWRYSPHTDRNYTMGFGIARTGAAVIESGHERVLRLADRLPDWLLGRAARAVGVHVDFLAALTDSLNPKGYGELLFGTAFTPESLHSPAVQQGDRPYAFLLGVTLRRSTVIQQLGKPAITTELTIGTIGSRLGRNVQRAIHDYMREAPACDTADLKGTGPCDPKGWQYQLHDTRSIILGVPTVRYAMAAEWLVPPSYWKPILIRGDILEVVPGIGVEAGYYTDAYYGARARFGLFKTPFYSWWESPLSSGNVIRQRPQQDPSVEAYLREQCEKYDRCRSDLEVLAREPSRWEIFVHGGFRHRSWLYNALLEGYPGYEGFAIPRSNVVRFTKEAQAGLTLGRAIGWSRQCNVQGTWMFHESKSSEFRSPRQRSHNWGGAFASVSNGCHWATWFAVPTVALGIIKLR